ncbi:hypothetical protein GOP47_0004457 [Adiantum capillus-veneris]|uniref:Uncharacterized protein n=1 Tax=Adiantum capillus-veneris TaxID=13818 RepID=A0A9D4V850_ADICA|nr:hypothetical protein GOP47_0004457 [Adiantum capillus-veneris]
MEQMNRSGRPPPPANSPSFLSSPWKHSLPYNALSEEGSFALYAPSPLLSSPMRHSSILAGKDPAFPFRGRNEQLSQDSQGSMPRNLTRRISSSDSLRRHRRPLSELLSDPDGPPSPLPAYHHINRRPTLSTLMAGSLDFDKGPRMNEPGIYPPHIPSYTRHQTASFATPLVFPNAERSSHLLPSHGFLSRARSDRYDLDRVMGRSLFDPQDFQYDEGLDPMRAMQSPVYNSNANVDFVRVHKFANGGEDVYKDDSANEHTYKRMQYTARARSHVKSQDLKAPLSPMLRAFSYTAGNVHQAPNYDDVRPSNGGVCKKVTMRDIFANHIDLGKNPSYPVHHHKQNGAGAVSFDNHRISLDGFEDRAYNITANAGDRQNVAVTQALDPHGSTYFKKSVSVNRQNGAVTHALDPHGSTYIKKSGESVEQPYKNGNIAGYGHRSAEEELPTGDVPLSNKNISQFLFDSVSKKQAFSGRDGYAAAIHGERSKNYTGSNASSNHEQDHSKKRVASTLTKGHSVLDYVTENIVGKLILLCEKCDGQFLNEAATISAKLLFKRVLLVQIQAVAPRLVDICADERQLEAHMSWAFQPSPTSSNNHVGKRWGQLSHEGLSLLHLQRVLYETGTSTFDTLMKIRGSLHELLIKPRDAEMSNQAAALRVACVGGAPGSAAVAVRLFLLMMRPEWQVQVDVWGGAGGEEEGGRRRIVEGMRMREIEWVRVEGGAVRTGSGGAVEMVRRSAGRMKQYKVLMMVNCASSSSSEGGGQLQQQQLWRNMWERLYENAAPGAAVVVYERVPCRWDDIAPSSAPWQFASPAPRLDCVRVGRKQLVSQQIQISIAS